MSFSADELLSLYEEAEKKQRELRTKLRDLESDMAVYRAAARQKFGMDLVGRSANQKRIEEELSESEIGAVEYATDAIVNLLRVSKQPLSPSQIVRALSGRGVKVDPHYVSNSLSRMAKRGRVVRRGRGKWVAGGG